MSEEREKELEEEKALGNPTDFGIQTKLKFILVPNSQCFAILMTSFVQRILVTFSLNLEFVSSVPSLTQMLHAGVYSLFHCLPQSADVQERNTHAQSC